MILRLPRLCADVVEAFNSESRRKLRESVMWVHFDAVVFSAALIRWLECAVVSWAVEGNQLIESVAHAFEGAACAIGYAVGGSSFATVLIVFTDDLLWDFHEAVKDVAYCPSKFACGGVSRAGRSLNVGHDT